MAALSFQRFDTDGARAHRDVVSQIHRDAYAERIATCDPFYSAEAFMQRFDAYTARPGLDLVIGYEGSEPISQAWGWAVRPGGAAWHGLEEDPDRPPDFTDEDGKRTFALSEIMLVRPRWSCR